MDVNSFLNPVENREYGFLAVDPGVTTGFIIGYLMKDDTCEWIAGEITGPVANQVMELNSIMAHMSQLDEIIMEDFEFAVRTLKGGDSARFTARMFFGFLTFLDMGNLLGDADTQLPVEIYSPSTLKVSVPDEYMKAHGAWIEGSKQARDAMRIVLHHAKRNPNQYKAFIPEAMRP